MNAATEILNQLGGNKFIAMTGAKNLHHSNNGTTLSMQIMRNASKVKWVRVSLTEMDTYNMEFIAAKGKYDCVTVAEKKGVYNDMLQSTFTSVTGLDTHL